MEQNESRSASQDPEALGDHEVCTALEAEFEPVAISKEKCVKPLLLICP